MSRIIIRPLINISWRRNCILTKARDIGTTEILKVPEAVRLPKPPKRKELELKWSNVFLTLGAGGILLMYMQYKKEKRATLGKFGATQSVGKAAIGGDFELQDSEGNIVRASDLLNQWVLIYFGFTYCPDICPAEIEKLARVIDTLENKYKLRVKPVFITVDPKRDTPAVVGKYAKEFSDKILALSGTREQVEKACKAYRVYFSSIAKDEDTDYLVDHTIITYFMDPNGQFVHHFGQTDDVDAIVSKVSSYILSHKPT